MDEDLARVDGTSDQEQAKSVSSRKACVHKQEKRRRKGVKNWSDDVRENEVENGDEYGHEVA